MFIFVYNSVQALGTLGPVLDSFLWGVVRLNYTSFNLIILISRITLIDERFTCFHATFYTNLFIYYRENTGKLPYGKSV